MINPNTTSPKLTTPAAGLMQIPKWTVTAYLLAYFGAYFIVIVPVATTLAIKISEVVAADDRAGALGVVSGIGAFAALVASPILGTLSDRTTSRFGMRRPWILGGALVATAAIAVLAFATSVLVVGAAWAVVQIAMQGVLGGLAAFLPDRVPERSRGKIGALVGTTQQFAPLFGLAVASAALAFGLGTAGMFLVPSLIGLALIALYVFTLRDRVLSPNLRAPFRFKTIYMAFAINPRKHPDFGWAWVGRFLVGLAFAAGSTYQVYFLNDRLDIPLTEIPTLQILIFLIGTVLATAGALIAGPLSDRLHRRKVFVFIATALVAVSTIVMAFSFDLTTFFIAIVINGIALGSYFAVDVALVTDVLPNKETEAAKGMGMFNIANTLPQSVAPAVAPLLLAIGGGGNYTAMFIGAAVVAVLGALSVVPIKSVR